MTLVLAAAARSIKSAVAENKILNLRRAFSQRVFPVG